MVITSAAAKNRDKNPGNFGGIRVRAECVVRLTHAIPYKILSFDGSSYYRCLLVSLLWAGENHSDSVEHIARLLLVYLSHTKETTNRGEDFMREKDSRCCRQGYRDDR